MRSGFFTSVNGDRIYSASFFAEYFASFISNGVFPNPASNLQVIENTGMTVTARIGRAWIDGYILFNDTDESIALDPGDAALSRVDKIVIRLDKINRVITVVVKKGIPATVPTAPSLQRDSDAYELGIANVRVGAGATGITQSDITDLRLNNSECGLVHAVVDKIDTTAIFNQFEAWYAQTQADYTSDLTAWTLAKKNAFDTWYSTNTTEFLSRYNTWHDTNTTAFESEFNTWFAGVQDTLDENVSGNLFNLIYAIPKIYPGVSEPAEAKTGDYWFKELI